MTIDFTAVLGLIEAGAATTAQIVGAVRAGRLHVTHTGQVISADQVQQFVDAAERAELADGDASAAQIERRHPSNE